MKKLISLGLLSVGLFAFTEYTCVTYKAAKGDVSIKFKPSQRTLLKMRVDDTKLVDLESGKVYPYFITIKDYDIYQKGNLRIAVPEIENNVTNIIIQDIKSDVFTYAVCEKDK